jgi:hypothetical protein
MIVERLRNGSSPVAAETEHGRLRMHQLDFLIAYESACMYSLRLVLAWTCDCSLYVICWRELLIGGNCSYARQLETLELKLPA